MKPLRKQGIILFTILALIMVACGGDTAEETVEEAAPEVVENIGKYKKRFLWGFVWSKSRISFIFVNTFGDLCSVIGLASGLLLPSPL